MLLLIVDNTQSHIPNRNGLKGEIFQGLFCTDVISNTSAIFFCVQRQMSNL